MGEQIFTGLKVVDFCSGAAGPCVGRELAMHGATVVRVESYRAPDSLRLMMPFKDFRFGVNNSAYGVAYMTQKYNVSLDAHHPKGMEAIKKLIAWADVMGESFAPGSMTRLGLDYENVKKIKPDIIYFSSSQMGQTGPLAGFRGYGMFGVSYGGFCHILGLPDRDPLPPVNSHSDFVSYPHLTCYVIGAILHHRKTGEGVYIDLSQIETGIDFLGPAILDYTVNGHILNRMGNKDPYMAPHGSYRCLGESCWKEARWVVIAVTSEQEWKSFCRVLGDPDWTKEPRFSTVLGRKENEEELDKLIESWTKDYTPEQVMTMLQDAGVPCGILETAEDLFNDPQLKHREHLRILEHREIGKMAHNAPAYRLSKTPCHIWKAGPCIGEDNEYVMKEILGYTEDEIADLLAEGALTTEADLFSSLMKKS